MVRCNGRSKVRVGVSSRKRTDQFRIHYMLSVLVEAMAIKVNYKILPFGCQNSMIT